MKLNQKINDDSKGIIKSNKRTILVENIESLHYLYPNAHKITNQMRWFKGSRDRGLRSDKAA